MIRRHIIGGTSSLRGFPRTMASVNSRHIYVGVESPRRTASTTSEQRNGEEEEDAQTTSSSPTSSTAVSDAVREHISRLEEVRLRSFGI